MMRIRQSMLIVNLLFSTLNILASDQKADSQSIVPAQKATPEKYAEYLDQLSFTAFHPHELNPALAAPAADGTEPIKKSLYGRFNTLPYELQLEILEYLSPQAPKILSTGTTMTEQDIESIKDFLRTHYWIKSMNWLPLISTFQEIKIKNRFQCNSCLSDYKFTQILNTASKNKFKKHSLEIAALALTCGANINEVIFCNVPLENAANHNMYTLSKFLILQGARIVLDNSHLITPWFDAIKNDNVVMTKLVIAADITFIHKDCYLVHAAARSNASRIIKYLHDTGRDLDQYNHQQMTPLHLAAQLKNHKAIETLITLGADPTLKDSLGRTYQDILNEEN